MLRKFMIEREIPGVGQLDSCALAQASRKSNAALEQVGPGIQWQQSYVTGDRTYCVYFAESEELIRKHAEASGFPASKIVEIKDVIDPATALR